MDIRGKILGYVCLGGFLALSVVLYAQGSDRPFENPILLAILNTVFLGFFPLSLAILAARSYESTRLLGFLLLGSGLCIFGVSSLLAGWVMPLAKGPNPTVTLHNLGCLFAGICELAGAHLFMQGILGKEGPGKALPGYKPVYLSILALVSLVAVLAFVGGLPVFFDPETGPSLVRQLVLGASIILFVLAGWMFEEVYAVFRTKFAYWFGMALWLMALGLGAVMVQLGVGSPLGWAGRAAQYTGALFLLIAFFQGNWEMVGRGAGRRIRSRWEFWPFLDGKVRERTDALQCEVIERSRIARELGESVELLRMASRAAGFGIFINNMESGASAWSSEVKALWGLGADEPVVMDGDGLIPTMHPEDRDRVRGVLRAAADPAGDGRFSFDHRIQTESGPIRWLHVEGRTEFHGEGGARRPWRALGAAVDISERKSVEERLEASLETNSTLLQELEHRVKNSFNMITSMVHFSSLGVSAEEKAVFDVLDHRINSISELYSLLYSNGSFEELRLDEYCAKIARRLVALVPGIDLAMELDPIQVSAKRAAPVGMIVTELVMNALKYAFPARRTGTITLRMERTESRIRIEIGDDGLGLPEGFCLAQARGVGLSLVQGLVGQILGSFGIHGDGRGTSCVVEFPQG